MLLILGGGTIVVLGLVMGSSWGWHSGHTIHSLLWGTVVLSAGISRLPPVRDAEQETKRATGGDDLPPQAPEPTRVDPGA
ncbi:hypothetical protein [Pseudofrankia sp. EUN1h]|uniref:hypothetical protein n=1 Tax=Pseudofrankia sp. EUN1h TaxID=1834515 RepID=UPI0002D6A8B6|nr:hypothetical protein [Pseudofrankia sp. EUN1h]OHV30331.1 hypothetical protein BCD49_34140 [Pseudofrankia sp. EUN1h]